MILTDLLSVLKKRALSRQNENGEETQTKGNETEESDNTQAGPRLLFFVTGGLFSFVDPGPAVDDGDEEEEGKKKEGKPCWGLAMGRTRVSDCLSRSLGRGCMEGRRY